MISDIQTILARLHIDKTGHYANHFYIVPLQGSEEYAKVYCLLDNNAINTEYPEITSNDSDNITRIIHYFELEEDTVTYNIFLFADFAEDKYFIKIGEKP